MNADVRRGTITLYQADAREALPRYADDTPAHDAHGRRIDYLRVSLTDRCNMRCVYCMPDIGMKYLPRAVAFRKLRAMADGATIVRAEIA